MGRGALDGCSFTQTADPVVAADGDSYERDALDAYFTACKRGKRVIVSPRTGEPMDAMMMPNRALLNCIRAEQQRLTNLNA